MLHPQEIIEPCLIATYLFKMTHAHAIAVLVAEDNPVNQEVIISMLEDYGIKPDLVSNGKEAFEKVREKHFDLVFMDCHMPDMNGFEATRLIRETAGEFNRVPIVAMTANVMMQNRKECAEAGMDDYLAKPLRQRDLNIVLERWLPDVDIHFKDGIVNLPANRPGNSHLDAVALQKMRQTLDKRFPAVLKTFLMNAQDLLNDMEQACKDEDWDALADAAHSLKVAGQIGAMELYSIAGAIEAASQNPGSQVWLLGMVYEAQIEFDDVKPQIENIIACS